MSRLTDYFENNRKIGTFGIKYLDDRLKGILKGDLILIGARSGAGKSTLAELIAQHNSSLGNKCALYSLENFKDDSFMTKAFYAYKRESGNRDLDLRDFASGDFFINQEALKLAEEYAEKFFENIVMTTRKKDFGLKELKDKMIKDVVEQDVRLLIIDHLDYVDKNNPNENDVSFMTDLMRTIRNLQDEFKVGVIAISHLRKAQNQKELPVVPSVDEFIGSGNKVKESTAVVMLSPDDEENMDNDSPLKVTWCSIKKLRMGGIDNKTAKLFFDRRTGRYTDEYENYFIKGKNKTKIL